MMKMSDNSMWDKNQYQTSIKRIQMTLITRLDILAHFSGGSESVLNMMSQTAIRMYVQTIGLQLLTLHTSQLNTLKMTQACV